MRIRGWASWPGKGVRRNAGHSAGGRSRGLENTEMNDAESMRWGDRRVRQVRCPEACGHAHGNITLAHYNNRKAPFHVHPMNRNLIFNSWELSSKIYLLGLCLYLVSAQRWARNGSRAIQIRLQVLPIASMYIHQRMGPDIRHVFHI